MFSACVKRGRGFLLTYAHMLLDTKKEDAATLSEGSYACARETHVVPLLYPLPSALRSSAYAVSDTSDLNAGWTAFTRETLKSEPCQLFTSTTKYIAKMLLVRE
jgi:hypothetical protein